MHQAAPRQIQHELIEALKLKQNKRPPRESHAKDVAAEQLKPQMTALHSAAEESNVSAKADCKVFVELQVEVTGDHGSARFVLSKSERQNLLTLTAIKADLTRVKTPATNRDERQKNDAIKKAAQVHTGSASAQRKMVREELKSSLETLQLDESNANMHIHVNASQKRKQKAADVKSDAAGFNANQANYSEPQSASDVKATGCAGTRVGDKEIPLTFMNFVASGVALELLNVNETEAEQLKIQRQAKQAELDNLKAQYGGDDDAGEDELTELQREFNALKERLHAVRNGQQELQREASRFDVAKQLVGDEHCNLALDLVVKRQSHEELERMHVIIENLASQQRKHHAMYESYDKNLDKVRRECKSYQHKCQHFKGFYAELRASNNSHNSRRLQITARSRRG